MVPATLDAPVVPVFIPAPVVPGIARFGAFQDLVELTPVEPDPPAFGAVVDLHTLPFAHDELRSIQRTVHAGQCTQPRVHRDRQPRSYASTTAMRARGGWLWPTATKMSWPNGA